MLPRKHHLVVLVIVAILIVSMVAPVMAAGGPTTVDQAQRVVDSPNVCLGDATTVTVEIQGSADPIIGGKNVVLIIDRSGSMGPDIGEGGGYFGGKTKLQLAQEAAIEFVDLMDFSQDRAALVSFSSDAQIDQALTSNKDSLTTSINALVANGGTNITAALQQAGTVLSGVSGGSIILLSDGENSPPQDSIPTARGLKTSGITIFTIGLGNQVNVGQLTGIAGTAATDTSGQGADYYYGQAQVPQELSDIYNRIYGAVYYEPAATDVTILENLSANVTFVPGSGSQFGTYTISADGRTLTIQISQLAAALNKFSYRVIANELGTYPAVDSGTVTYTANGQQSTDDITNNSTITVEDCAPPPNEIPEPTTILLLGTGLAGLAGYVRKRRNASVD